MLSRKDILSAKPSRGTPGLTGESLDQGRRGMACDVATPCVSFFGGTTGHMLFESVQHLNSPKSHLVVPLVVATAVTHGLALQPHLFRSSGHRSHHLGDLPGGASLEVDGHHRGRWIPQRAMDSPYGSYSIVSAGGGHHLPV